MTDDLEGITNRSWRIRPIHFVVALTAAAALCLNSGCGDSKTTQNPSTPTTPPPNCQTAGKTIYDVDGNGKIDDTDRCSVATGYNLTRLEIKVTEGATPDRITDIFVRGVLASLNFKVQTQVQGVYTVTVPEYEPNTKNPLETLERYKTQLEELPFVKKVVYSPLGYPAEMQNRALPSYLSQPDASMLGEMKTCVECSYKS